VEIYFKVFILTHFKMLDSEIISVLVTIYNFKLNLFQFVIGLLMALNTYNGPILWMLLLLRQLKDPIRNNVDSFRVFAFFRGSQLFVFSLVCLVCRYHLFVWTVFSPKLLYQGMETLVVTSLVIFVNLMRCVCHFKLKVQ